jgi:hypothetical protein
VLPPPEEEETEEVALAVEEYQPPPVGGGGHPMGHRGERAPRARLVGGPRGVAGSLRVHERRLRVHESRRPATGTSSTASDRAPALGLRRLGVAAAHASYPGELGP